MRTYASKAGAKDDRPDAFVLFGLFLIGVGGVSLARSFVQIGYAAYRGKAQQVPMSATATATDVQDISAYDLDPTDISAYELDSADPA